MKKNIANIINECNKDELIFLKDADDTQAAIQNLSNQVLIEIINDMGAFMQILSHACSNDLNQFANFLQETEDIVKVAFIETCLNLYSSDSLHGSFNFADMIYNIDYKSGVSLLSRDAQQLARDKDVYDELDLSTYTQ